MEEDLRIFAVGVHSKHLKDSEIYSKHIIVMVTRRKYKVKRRLRTRKAGQVLQSLLNDIVRLKPVQLPPGQKPVITKADYGLISEHHDVVPDVPPSYPTLSMSSQEDSVSTPEPSPLPAPRRRVKVVPASRKVVPAGRRLRRHTRKM